MKRLLFLFVLVAFTLSLKAQMEVVFDFNNCIEEQALNGQDGWYVRKHHPNTNGSAMYTGYLGHFWGDTPETLTADETLGVFSTASGTAAACEDAALKKKLENFDGFRHCVWRHCHARHQPIWLRFLHWWHHRD